MFYFFETEKRHDGTEWGFFVVFFFGLFFVCVFLVCFFKRRELFLDMQLSVSLKRKVFNL